ncbi:MAG: hypothetical protein KAG66_00545 [Methylococcales bacterium]|nr:hypothetical protein [Methylococcales bacterium]
MSMSDYAKNNILNHVLTATAYASPNATLHLALFTADPTDALVAANEVDVVVVDTAYARQLIAFDPSADPDNGLCKNNVACTFPPVVYGSGAAAYDATHIAVFDALTGGNMIYSTVLLAPITREEAKALTFDVGTVKVTQDN